MWVINLQITDYENEGSFSSGLRPPVRYWLGKLNLSGAFIHSIPTTGEHYFQESLHIVLSHCS